MKHCGPAIFLMLTCSGTAAGQAMVGYGLGAASASTAAAPARGVGTALEKAWEKAGKTVTSSPSTSSSRARAKANAAPSAHYEDPGTIETGIGEADLLRRFGPAAMVITGEDGGRTLTYVDKRGNAEVVIRGGKVYTVNVKRPEHAALSH